MKTVKESNIWSTFFHALDEKAENMGQRKKKKKGVYSSAWMESDGAT